MSTPSERDAVIIARLEGLDVEFERARLAFLSAAQDTLAGMEHAIIREFPEFYSNEQRERAGVPANWSDMRLWPNESKEWRKYRKAKARIPHTDLRVNRG
jgi:hypothetical protein